MEDGHRKDLMVPQTSFYVTDWLDKRSKLSPHRTGLVDLASGREITFAAWNAAATRTANFLAELGVKKGDRVSIHASNSVEYLEILFACGKLGAILHNLNWRLNPVEIRALIEDAEPRVLIYSPDWRERIDGLRTSLGSVEYILAIGEPAHPDDHILAERDDYPPTLAHRPDLTMDDPWAIYYTGGTTGLPKGAIMTHGNMTWNSINTITSWGIGPNHAAPLQLPLFHIGGPNIFMLPLVHMGGKTILCRDFDIDQTFDLIGRGVITHYVAVPTMYLMMQQHPRWQTTNFSRLELVISGGAPCPLPIMEAFWQRSVDFKTGYGLTEAAGNNFWLPPEDVRRKPGSVGFPLFHIDMKIVAEDGSECRPGQAGELLIRGPHVFPGYWQKPEASAEVLENGWLHTGDLAETDEDGYFRIIGRSKDMFISGGENVYPAEIESVLHAHPAVAEAAVIGVPHAKWGEVGQAFVVIEPGGTLGEDELREFLEERLARYKIPQRIVFVPELPRTAIGKLDKKRLAHEHGG